jgi:DNA-binding NarL/FixJ family response regulator
MVVDDSKLVREMLCAIIDDDIDLTVVAEAADGESALATARFSQPDVILLKTCMPTLNGIQTRKIHAEMPRTPIIAVSLDDEPVVRLEMRAAGVTTFIARNNIQSTLCATIRAIAHQAAERPIAST